MAVIDIKQSTIRVRDGSTPLPNSISIKVGEGNLTYGETRNREYILDRGEIDSVRDGDQAPLDLAFDLMWEEISASVGAGLPTVEDALKKRGDASAWVTSDTDTCQPYAVDIELELDATCGSVKDREYITFEDFRYESLSHDLRAATVAVSGMCNRLEAKIEHAHAPAVAALFVAANSEYLSIADNAALSATTDLTLALWFKPLAVGTQQFIASKWEDASQTAWAIELQAAGTLRISIAEATNDDLGDVNYVSATTLANDTWYFILVQYDGSQVGNAGRLRLWINDTEDTTGSYTGTVAASIGAETAAVRIGAFDTGPVAGFLDGVVSSVGMWLRSLTSAEKTAMYNGGLGLLYSDLTTAHKVSLAEWWALDEESGQRDASHSNNHLNDNASVLYADGVRKLKSGLGVLP